MVMLYCQFFNKRNISKNTELFKSYKQGIMSYIVDKRNLCTESLTLCKRSQSCADFDRGNINLKVEKITKPKCD